MNLAEVKRERSLRLEGKTFGRLTVIERDPNINRGSGQQAKWICVCDCGTEHSVISQSLINGSTRSCGCLKRDLGLKRKFRTNAHYLLTYAKVRAKRNNLEFSLTVSDILIPNVCPILGIPLYRAKDKKSKANSPSIDRINPARGYIPSNIWVISHRANMLKNSASISELRAIVRALELLGRQRAA